MRHWSPGSPLTATPGGFAREFSSLRACAERRRTLDFELDAEPHVELEEREWRRGGNPPRY